MLGGDDLTEAEAMFAGKPKSDDGLTEAERLFLPKVKESTPSVKGGAWWTPDRVNQAVNYLKTNAKLSDHGALGLVARWAAVEAGGGPDSVNPTSGAYGIGQWLGSRKTNVPKDFEGQLKHAAKELNTTEYKAAKRLRSAATPEEGAIGASMFERAEGYDPSTGRDNFTDKTIKAMRVPAPEPTKSHLDLTEAEKMFSGDVPTDSRGKPLMKPPVGTKEDVSNPLYGLSPEQFTSWEQTGKIPPIAVPKAATKPTGKTAKLPRTHTSVRILDDEQLVDPGTGEAIPQTGKPLTNVKESEADNAIAASITIPDSIKTQEEAQSYVNRELQTRFPGVDTSTFKFLDGYKPGNTYVTTYGDLKSAGYDTAPIIREKVVQNRVENPTPDLSPVNTGGYSAQDVADVVNTASDRLFGSKTPGRVFAAGLSGLSEIIPAYTAFMLRAGGGGVEDEILGNAGAKDPDTAYSRTIGRMRSFVDSVDKFHQATGEKDSPAATFIADMAGVTPKFMVMSALPGGIMLGMAMDRGGMGTIHGSNPYQFLGHTVRGSTEGAIFEAMPWFSSKLPFTSNLVKTGIEAPVLATSLYGLGAISGDNPQENLMNAGAMAIAHLLMKGGSTAWQGIKGKTFHGVDAEGNEVYQQVTGTAEKPTFTTVGKQEADFEFAVPKDASAQTTQAKDVSTKNIDTPEAPLPAESPFKAEDAVTTPDGPGKVLTNHLASDGSVFVQLEGDKGISLFKPEVLKNEVLEQTAPLYTAENVQPTEVAKPEALQPQTAAVTRPVDRYFNQEALDRAKNQSEKSREHLIYMPIDDFLSMAEELTTPLKYKTTRISDAILGNKPLASVPFLQIDRNGRVKNHEGRHRAWVLKALGETEIPVNILSDNIRWGSQGNPIDRVDSFPSTITSENGEIQKPFPKELSRFQYKDPEVAKPTETKEASIAGGGELNRDVQERRKAQDAANIDPRTGLGSKIAWSKAKPNIEADPNRGVISFDINRLKDVNDTTSHALVDEKVFGRLGEAAQEVAARHGLNPRDIFTPAGDEMYAGVPVDKLEAVRDDMEKTFGVVEITAEKDYTNSRTGEKFQKGDVIPVTLSGEFGQTVKDAEVNLGTRKEASKQDNPVRRQETSSDSVKEEPPIQSEYEAGDPVTIQRGAQQGQDGVVDSVTPEGKLNIKLMNGEEIRGMDPKYLDQAGFLDISFMSEPVRRVQERLKKAWEDSTSPMKHLEKAGVGMQAVRHAYSRISVPFEVNSILSDVFPDSYTQPEVMAKTIRIINLDNILDGYYQYRQRSQQAIADGEMGQAAKWQQKAEDINDKYPIKDLIDEILNAKNDPEIMGNIERWKQTVNPRIDELYRKVKGLEKDEELPGRGHLLGARINLLPEFKVEEMKRFDDLGSPMPESSYSNYKNPFGSRDAYDRAASFTGDYSADPQAVLRNVLGPRVTMATRLDLYQALIDTGNAVYGDKPANINGRDPVFFKIDLPESSGPNNRTRLVHQAMWVDPKLAVPLRRVLNTDLRATQKLRYSFLNAFQVAQAVDLVAHLKNVHTVIAYAPKIGNALGDAALRLPGIGTADTLRRIRDVSRDIDANDGNGTPEIRAKKAEMAANGMLRPEYPARGAQKHWPFNISHKWLYRVDTAARIIMDGFFDQQVEAGRITGTPDEIAMNKRNFVQQIGEYNDRLMSKHMADIKSSGFAPFVVAGTTFNRMGIKMLTGDPGFKAKDTATAAKVRATMLLSGYVAATVITAMLNLGTTGSIGGRPGTPIGAWDPGFEEDDKGKHKVFDIHQLLGYRRGERLLGINELLAGLRNGADANEILGKMQNESVSAWSHPWMGPGPGFYFRALTGRKLDLRGDEHDYMGPRDFEYGAQSLENLRVAIRDTNPLAYSIVTSIPGVDKFTPAYERQPYNIKIPGTDVHLPETLAKIFSGFGKTPVQTSGYTSVKTPATKLMDEIADQKFEVDPDTEQSRSDAAQLLKDARTGTPSAEIQERLSKAVNSGALKLNQVAKLQDNLNLSPTAVKFKYMVTDSVSDIIRVWERMTPKEKQESFGTMLGKLANMGDKITPTDAAALKDMGIDENAFNLLSQAAEAKQAKALDKFNAEQSIKAGEKPDLSGMTKSEIKNVATKGAYTQDQKDFEGKTPAQQTFIYTNSPPEKQKEYRIIMVKSFQNLMKKKSKTPEEVDVLRQLTKVLFSSPSQQSSGKEEAQP